MTKTPQILLPLERITQTILLVRGSKVILDADLATLYGVETRILNQAIKRNEERFPSDFAFRLTTEELGEVISICDHLKKLKFSKVTPLAFTEHGVIAAAFVLNSPMAVAVSVQVVRAFAQLKQMAATHQDLARKLEDLERKTDTQFRAIFEAIRELMADSHTHSTAATITVQRKD